MISSEVLEEVTTGYRRICKEKHISPTKKGLADLLHITDRTINNVIHGFYNGGKPYTDKPAAMRCISNADFELIRNLFKERNIEE